MKRVIKIILIGIGSMILLISLFFVGYMYMAKSELKVMTPTDTREIVGNIFSIRDSFVNMYLIKDGNQFIAVDAGNNTENAAKELKKLNINPDLVVAVLLTHTDEDHVAAIRLFRNAKVYISRQEVQLINGKKSRFLCFGNDIGTKDYVVIDDQQGLIIGNTKIKGVLTPGHTIGSMCYLINEKYLFTGDALSLKAGRIDQFNRFFNSDSKLAKQSISKITNLPTAEYIFTAHYGYSADYKNAVKMKVE